MEQSDHHRRRRLGFSLHQDSLGGNLVLRPIVNVMLGTWPAMRVLVAGQLGEKPTPICRFLDGGRFRRTGAGRGTDAGLRTLLCHRDIDAELRYSYMHLQSFGSSAEVVQGEASRGESRPVSAAAAAR